MFLDRLHMAETWGRSDHQGTVSANADHLGYIDSLTDFVSDAGAVELI
jgi:hypothetical protein